MKKLIEWLKGAFEGNDNKASSRMLTGFWFVFLITLVIASIEGFVWYGLTRTVEISDNELKAAGFLITVLELLLGSVLLIYGVVTAQQIVALKTMNPAPPTPTTNVTNVQTDKAIVNNPPTAEPT